MTKEEITAMTRNELQVYGKELEASHEIEINLGGKTEDIRARVLEAFEKHGDVKTPETPTEDSPAETSPKTEEEGEPEKKVVAGYMSKAVFKDWESGWTFDPFLDKEPKKLPKKLTRGLKLAIKEGRLFPVYKD